MTDPSKPKRTAPKGFGASSPKPEESPAELETAELETPEPADPEEVSPVEVQQVEPDSLPPGIETVQPLAEQSEPVLPQLRVDHQLEVQLPEVGGEFATAIREEPVEGLAYDAYPVEIQSTDFRLQSVEPTFVEPVLERSANVSPDQTSNETSELSESDIASAAEPVVKSDPDLPKVAEPVVKSEPIAARAPEPIVKPTPAVSPLVNIKMEPPMSLESSQKELEKGLDSIKDDLESAKDELETVKDKVVKFFADLPENTGNFFNEYQRPLITVGLLLALLITLRVLIGLVNVLNGIPLVKPTFQAIGLGYSGWFIYRYLLRSETRQELSQKWQSFKDDVVGQSQSL